MPEFYDSLATSFSLSGPQNEANNAHTILFVAGFVCFYQITISFTSETTTYIYMNIHPAIYSDVVVVSVTPLSVSFVRISLFIDMLWQNMKM